MHIFRIISGILFGLAPLALFLVFGSLVYIYFPNSIGIAVVCLFGIVGSIIGYQIFKQVKKIGPIAFMTSLYSTSSIKVKK